MDSRPTRFSERPQPIVYLIAIFFIRPPTEMLPVSPFPRPSELLQRCRQKLVDLVSHPDLDLRLVVGHSYMLDIVIDFLGVDYSGYSDLDVMKNSDPIASSYESDLQSDFDSDSDDE